MTETLPAVTLTDLGFTWPDGSQTLANLNAVFGSRRIGLIGRNGTGKTTLLRLIAGDLRPTHGAIATTGTVGFLPQGRRRDDATVAHALNIENVLAARTAIEAGSTDQRHYDTLDGRWDLPERALAALSQAGLPDEPKDLWRHASTLSGGEWTLTCLLGVLLAEPDILLLDEPSNDLDTRARERLREHLETWTGPMILASHDRDLLEGVDEIALLQRGTLQFYGGAYSDHLAAVEAAQIAADRAVRTAAEHLKLEEKQKAAAHIALTRRQRYAATDHANKRRPKVVMNERKRQAQVSAGKYRLLHEGKVETARETLAEAELSAQRDDVVRIELPDTAVPTGKHVLALRQGESTRLVTGPERIALAGANGSGKTTLLDLIADRGTRVSNGITLVGPEVPFVYLDQHLSDLDPDATVADQVRLSAPERTVNDVHAQLAKLLLRGRKADQRVGDLSGGERARVALAAALLATPAPQLLLLDEPTNNLDLASTAEFSQALNAYEGALIIASHDRHVLRDVRTTRTWTCRHPGALPDDSL